MSDALTNKNPTLAVERRRPGRAEYTSQHLIRLLRRTPAAEPAAEPLPFDDWVDDGAEVVEKPAWSDRKVLGITAVMATAGIALWTAIGLALWRMFVA